MDKFLELLEIDIKEQQQYLDDARKNGSDHQTKMYFLNKKMELQRIKKMAEMCFFEE